MMSPTEKKVRELHESAIVVDGHSDILIPVSNFGLSLATRHEAPDRSGWEALPWLAESLVAGGMGLSAHTVLFSCIGQYDLPRWKEGGLTGQLCAIYIEHTHQNHAFQRGLEMVWNFHAAISGNSGLVHATTSADIRQAKIEGKVALVLSFEGCEALGADPRMLDIYHRLGLRAASLTHIRRNQYADGCWAADVQGGLTSSGISLVRRMEELGIVIDLVHMGERGVWEILGMARKPVILSHSTPTMFPSSEPGACAVPGGSLPRPRLELPRDRVLMEALGVNGGVLGIIWATQESLETVIRDIETALEVMGPDHLGLGSDLCGVEIAPEGLQDISCLPHLTAALVSRGHSDDVILKILGENYLRVFQEVCDTKTVTTVPNPKH